MEKRDGRSLSHATLEEIRIRAVQRVEAGESPEVVVKALGFSRPRIYEWLALYREGGLEALRAKPVPGAKPKLEGKALDWLYRTITLSNPQQFKFEFALWTRAMVRELIRRQFKVAMSEVSVPPASQVGAVAATAFDARLPARSSAGHRLDHTSFRVFARKPRQPGRTSSSATRPRYGRTITPARPGHRWA
jgi:transposase